MAVLNGLLPLAVLDSLLTQVILMIIGKDVAMATTYSFGIPVSSFSRIMIPMLTRFHHWTYRRQELPFTVQVVVLDGLLCLLPRLVLPRHHRASRQFRRVQNALLPLSMIVLVILMQTPMLMQVAVLHGLLGLHPRLLR